MTSFAHKCLLHPAPGYSNFGIAIDSFRPLRPHCKGAILGVSERLAKVWAVQEPGCCGGGADKIAVEQDSIQRGHKVLGSEGFYDVPQSAGEERIAHDVPGGVLREEKYPGFRRHFQDLPGYLNSAHVRKPDIEYHDVRLKL